MSNASGQQSEHERQWKRKSEGSTYDISSIKRVTRKIHVVVVQNIAIKKRLRHVQSCLFLFLLFSLPSPLSPALHDFFCWI